MKATVFLGGGRITSALISGLRLARYDKPIVVHDHNPEKLRRLKQRYGVITEPNMARAVAQANLLIVAVRPKSVRDLLTEIGKLDRPVTAVSLAAGVRFVMLRKHLGPQVRWARAMPSPVCSSGRGLTAIAFDRGFPRNLRGEVNRLFAKVGAVVDIPDSRLDAFTVTYSSSHGYHALAALSEAAEKLGLDRRSARIAAAHALADGIRHWVEGNVSLQDLLHEAATPGGTAAAVMSAMDKAGYRKVVERGLRAGLARTRKNTQS